MKKVIKLRANCSFPLKLNLKMRITTSLLLLVSLFQLQANETYAQKTKVSFEYKNVSLETVFNKIESITDFKFIYKDKEIDYKQKVTIKIKKESISKVLKKLLNNSKITYLVNGKQIILKPLKTAINSKKVIKKEKNLKNPITGSVVDKNGNSLPGASIIEKGTSNGTETDFDGNFKISVENDDSILVIQYLGYTKKEVAVKNASIIQCPKIIPINDNGIATIITTGALKF